MPKNNSRDRKAFRRQAAELRQEEFEKLSDEEKTSRANANGTAWFKYVGGVKVKAHA